MFCKSCGAENEEGAKFCRSCGLPIVPEEVIRENEEIKQAVDNAESATAGQETAPADQPESGNTVQEQVQPDMQAEPQPQPNGAAENLAGQYQGQPQPQQGYYQQQYKPSVTKSAPNAVISLILGIVSVVCCCTCLLGVGCGIAAICVGVSSKKKENNPGMATAGIVLGIVGIVISVLSVIIFMASGAFVGFMEAFREGRLQDYFKNIDQWSNYGSDYNWWS